MPDNKWGFIRNVCSIIKYYFPFALIGFFAFGLFFSACVLTFCAWVWWHPDENVWTDPVSEAASPNGEWKAIVDRTVYEASFDTAITDRVHLTSLSQSDHSVEIVAVDTEGQRAHPYIAWIGPMTLQITIDNMAYATMNGLLVEAATNLRFHQVVIHIRFDPDNSAARAAWLEDKCSHATCR